MIMKLWVARDEDGWIYLYTKKPYRNVKLGIFECSNKKSHCEPIGKRHFPSVTWENSPQEVELKLINNNSK